MMLCNYSLNDILQQGTFNWDPQTQGLSPSEFAGTGKKL